MNRLLLLCFALVSGSAWGQYSQNAPINLERITLDEKSWITSAGFPLNEYDYSNATINLELSTALQEKKQGKLFTTLSWVGLGAGLLLRFVPSDIDISRTTISSASTLMLLGGLTMSLTGMYKKNTARKRVQNARYLFYDK